MNGAPGDTLAVAVEEGMARSASFLDDCALPPEARALQAALGADFGVRDFAFPALALHVYKGGPWQAAGRWPFRGKRAKNSG